MISKGGGKAVSYNPYADLVGAGAVIPPAPTLDNLPNRYICKDTGRYCSNPSGCLMCGRKRREVRE